MARKRRSDALGADGDPHLNDLAVAARILAGAINALSKESIAALDAERWNTAQSFALRAELTRLAECAEKAQRQIRSAVP